MSQTTMCFELARSREYHDYHFIIVTMKHRTALNNWC